MRWCDNSKGSKAMNEGHEAVRQRLDELGRLIEERRKALEHHELVSEELRGEWDDMLRRHQELCRRSQSQESTAAAARETLEEDIDVLRHAFFRWAARVDERFNKPGGSST